MSSSRTLHRDTDEFRPIETPETNPNSNPTLPESPFTFTPLSETDSPTQKSEEEEETSGSHYEYIMGDNQPPIIEYRDSYRLNQRRRNSVLFLNGIRFTPKELIGCGSENCVRLFTNEDESLGIAIRSPINEFRGEFSEANNAYTNAMNENAIHNSIYPQNPALVIPLYVNKGENWEELPDNFASINEEGNMFTWREVMPYHGQSDVGDLFYYLNWNSTGTLYLTLLLTAEAIADIHDKGFIHGDIHAGNIVTDEHLNPTIVDFGHSVEIGENRKGSRISHKGSHFPPEVKTPRTTAQPNQDVYQFCYMLRKHILRKGRKPSDCEITPSVIKHIVKEGMKDIPAERISIEEIIRVLEIAFNNAVIADHLAKGDENHPISSHFASFNDDFKTLFLLGLKSCYINPDRLQDFTEENYIDLQTATEIAQHESLNIKLSWLFTLISKPNNIADREATQERFDTFLSNYPNINNNKENQAPQNNVAPEEQRKTQIALDQEEKVDETDNIPRLG